MGEATHALLYDFNVALDYCMVKCLVLYQLTIQDHARISHHSVMVQDSFRIGSDVVPCLLSGVPQVTNIFFH